MVDLIQRSIGPTIRLEVQIEATPAAALVDPNQLELALLNLAVNARDAMPEGGKLTIETSRVDIGSDQPGLIPGPYALIRVADTGAGMDAATLARAVEPFYSTKGVGKGTGLGLSMVHGLAAQSGGALVLESAPGIGTTARLWLPAAIAEAVAPTIPSDDWQRNGQALKILLVDDEELVRTGTAEMLADMGHEIVQVSSGAAALGALRSQAFDILVTDYLMPSMSGLELAREARKLRRDLPVLMITGFADLADDRGLDVARLAKPFHMDELARAIELEMAPSSENRISAH
jgi:CheY-like chemotaxis protein